MIKIICDQDNMWQDEDDFYVTYVKKHNKSGEFVMLSVSNVYSFSESCFCGTSPAFRRTNQFVSHQSLANL